MASEWQTAFVVSHKMPWWALLTAVKNCNKSRKKTSRLFLQDRDQDQMLMTKTKTSWSKTKIFIFVLEAPRDQDPGLEDYMTVFFRRFLSCASLHNMQSTILFYEFCLSIRTSVTLWFYLNESNFTSLWCGHHSSFWAQPSIQNSTVRSCHGQNFSVHKCWHALCLR